MEERRRESDVGVKDYKELEVYRLAFDAAMEIFEISKTFLQEEKYSLTDQLRRSSRSVCANVAEAWRKRRYEAAFVSKLSDADTEAAETEVWLDFSLKCGYIQEAVHKKLRDKYDHICRQLYTMMKDAPSWRLSSSLHAERSTLHAPRASSDAPRSTLNASRASSDAPRSTLHAPRAFTLIEVLVAMTVLAVMVLMVANIFQSSSAAWNIGTQKADMNTAARAALDYMARELASAIAGPIEKSGSGGAQYLTFRQETTNDLRFLTMTEDPDSSSRALRESYFWFENQKLRYGRIGNPDCYTDEGWYSSKPAGVAAVDLITNVLSLQFDVYTNMSDMLTGTPAPSAAETFYQLPVCVDIALEMLSDDDMRRYIATGNDQAFRDRNAKLYSTRVYFPNRRGYQAR